MDVKEFIKDLFKKKNKKYDFVEIEKRALAIANKYDFTYISSSVDSIQFDYIDKEDNLKKHSHKITYRFMVTDLTADADRIHVKNEDPEQALIELEKQCKKIKTKCDE